MNATTLDEIVIKVVSTLKLISIHKKVRGMRRRARKLSSWADIHKELDLEYLYKYHKDYVKIWISPFNHLYKYNDHKVGKKNPPVRFCKEILYHLIEIYLEWEKRLEKIEEPYYLRLWIGDPEFIDSQVVAATEHNIEYYEELFMKDNEYKEFPYQDVHPLVSKFTWERCVNGYYVWESDIESEEERTLISKNGFQVNEHLVHGEVEKLYFIRTGDMWLGSIRRSANST
ncbi:MULTISPECIES: hypothetical protein [unclassified Paenibacillus]|uniref:hypothetical protein n=1 Tax=unclassified Paenibacillus TaxID=185978 RepID=UPI003F7FE2C5